MKPEDLEIRDISTQWEIRPFGWQNVPLEKQGYPLEIPKGWEPFAVTLEGELTVWLRRPVSHHDGDRKGAAVAFAEAFVRALLRVRDPNQKGEAGEA